MKSLFNVGVNDPRTDFILSVDAPLPYRLGMLPVVPLITTC